MKTNIDDVATLTEQEAAKRLGISTQKLVSLRTQGEAPPYTKRNGKILYADLGKAIELPDVYQGHERAIRPIMDATVRHQAVPGLTISSELLRRERRNAEMHEEYLQQEREDRETERLAKLGWRVKERGWPTTLKELAVLG